MESFERYVGKVLDRRYHIIRVIGFGGMAVVYEARDIVMNRTVAVKMLKDEIAGDDANYKMNPPLRSAADVEALVDGLADGTMEAISTDHAPHGEEEKKQSIAKAPFGIVGSETAYALSVTHLVKTGKLTPLQLVERMSTNPCRILSVPGGTLSVGAPADITIADMDSEYVIDKNTFLSKGKNTPFDGAKVNGRVYYTIVGGNIVYQYE